jgi:hypothetical protein
MPNEGMTGGCELTGTKQPNTTTQNFVSERLGELQDHRRCGYHQDKRSILDYPDFPLASVAGG